MSGRLAGKSCIVTGAGQGIGAAIATRFASEGASVVIADRNAITGAEVADAIEASGGVAHSVVTDVTDRAQVEALASRTVDLLGGVDILVNNAGANVFHEPLSMPEDEWERCLTLDLRAAWDCARAVLPHMLSLGRGSIVNIASVHSFKIIPHTFPYPVAKHGLIGLTRSLAIEYAARGIRVNAIAPGYILTPIAEAYWATFPDPAGERARAERIHPPGRIGTPDDVAHAALFLASDEAGFINAETIVVDGGRSAVYHD